MHEYLRADDIHELIAPDIRVLHQLIKHMS